MSEEQFGLITVVDSQSVSKSIDNRFMRTNCLDGLLRNANDEVVKLNHKDFIHQTYFGQFRSDTVPHVKARRFVFKKGSLIEIGSDDSETVFSCF